MKLTRREFFIKTLQGAALVAIPATLTTVLESCSNNVTDPASAGSGLATLQGNESNGIITVSVDPSSALAKDGGAAIVNAPSGSYLVDHPSGNTYNALSSICTHQSCTVSRYDSGNNQFVCPCHGSRFDLNGQVVQGPARGPLTKFQAQFANNQLTINV